MEIEKERKQKMTVNKLHKDQIQFKLNIKNFKLKKNLEINCEKNPINHRVVIPYAY